MTKVAECELIVLVVDAEEALRPYGETETASVNLARLVADWVLGYETGAQDALVSDIAAQGMLGRMDRGVKRALNGFFMKVKRQMTEEARLRLAELKF